MGRKEESMLNPDAICVPVISGCKKRCIFDIMLQKSDLQDVDVEFRQPIMNS